MKTDKNSFGCLAEVTNGCGDDFAAIIRVTDAGGDGRSVAIDLTRKQVFQLIEALQARVPDRRKNKTDRRKK